MNGIKSAFLRLSWQDVRRGLGLAIGAAATYLFSVMASGGVPDSALWKSTVMVFVGTIGSYLVKNLLTNSGDQFLKKEGQ